MKATQQLLLALVVLGALLLSARFLLAVQGAARSGKRSSCRALDAEPVDRPAPAFQLEDLQGRAVSLADHRGELVLLNFWATWCPPCVDELPSLAWLQRRMEGKKFAMITVSVDESAKEVQDFLAKQPAGVRGLPVAVDPSKKIPASYGTVKFPETFLIDARGIIRYKLIYKRDWSSPRALACIDSLL